MSSNLNIFNKLAKNCPASGVPCAAAHGGVFFGVPGLYIWALPFVLMSKPSVDKEEGGRGRGPTGVAG